MLVQGLRLALLHRPTNRYDHNAIEVWLLRSSLERAEVPVPSDLVGRRWMLGHLPRSDASRVVRGWAGCRAYVHHVGDGLRWAVEMRLEGDIIDRIRAEDEAYYRDIPF